MKARTKSESLLLALLIAGIASTAVHYSDNALHNASYPEPGYVTPGLVAGAWLALTSIGVLGYRLYASGRMPPAYTCLAIYSYTGISTPGHYLYGDPSELALWRNVSIVSDGLTGLAILGFVMWSVLVAREWMQPSRAAA